MKLSQFSIIFTLLSILKGTIKGELEDHIRRMDQTDAAVRTQALMYEPRIDIFCNRGVMYVYCFLFVVVGLVSAFCIGFSLCCGRNLTMYFFSAILLADIIFFIICLLMYRFWECRPVVRSWV